MKLYVAPYAPNPRRVSMFLAEKGIDGVEFVNVDLQNGAQRAPEFLRMSPLAQTPVLELEDGRTLSESRAICSYLEHVYPDPNLMGATGEERAFVEMWDRRMEWGLLLPLAMWVRHGSPALAAVERDQTPGVASFNQKQAMQNVVWLDEELASKPWVAGERFTIADITAACAVDFAKLMKWRPDDSLPNLRRWRVALSERPSGQVKP